jgi:hypothetical protein
MVRRSCRRLDPARFEVWQTDPCETRSAPRIVPPSHRHFAGPKAGGRVERGLTRGNGSVGSAQTGPYGRNDALERQPHWPPPTDCGLCWKRSACHRGSWHRQDFRSLAPHYALPRVWSVPEPSADGNVHSHCGFGSRSETCGAWRSGRGERSGPHSPLSRILTTRQGRGPRSHKPSCASAP